MNNLYTNRLINILINSIEKRAVHNNCTLIMFEFPLPENGQTDSGTAS